MREGEPSVITIKRGPERAPGWALLLAWVVNLPSPVLLLLVVLFSLGSLLATALIGAIIGAGGLLPTLLTLSLLVSVGLLLNRGYGRTVWDVTTLVAERRPITRWQRGRLRH